MEKFEELSQNSQKRIHVADHMLTQTFPLVQDPKLLLTVVENTFLALTNSMSALLHYERLFKRVPEFTDTFESKIRLFSDKVGPRYNIDRTYITLMREIKDIIIEHRNSPVEFVRKDRFVICSDSYRTRTIDINQMKKYVREAKSFSKMIAAIIAQRESIRNERSY